MRRFLAMAVAGFLVVGTTACTENAGKGAAIGAGVGAGAGLLTGNFLGKTAVGAAAGAALAAPPSRASIFASTSRARS